MGYNQFLAIVKVKYRSLNQRAFKINLKRKGQLC